jgi:hypothetical protein
MPGQAVAADVASQGLRGAPRWWVVATSVAGTQHHTRGQPCQDAYYWCTLPDEVLVAAVADGAGSATLGKVGATLAAGTAATTVCSTPQGAGWPASDEAWRQRLIDAMRAAQASVVAEARARQVSVRDLASTLILVVAMSDRVAVAHIGDGAVVVSDQAGRLIALTVPQSGAYPNETTFLLSPQALDTAQVCVWHGLPRHVIAFSDGLQRLALHMPAGHPHAPFFVPLLRFMETVTEGSEAHAQVEALLRSPRMRARTDDDITLLLGALRRPGSDAGPLSL